MAAPTRVGYQGVNTGNGTAGVTFTVDGTIANGDWMIAVLSWIFNGSSVPQTVGGGWTQIGTTTTNGTLSTAIYVRQFSTGETGYTLNPNSLSVAYTSSLSWFRGCAPYSNWIIGSQGSRAASGGTFTTTAPSLTTTSASNLIISLFTERTLASETDITSISGATEWYFVAQVTNNTDTVMLAYSTQTVAGATPAVSAVYPNTQPTNGWAMQIALPPAAANISPTASFTSTPTNLTVAFNGSASNDPDGSIASYAWTFGDSGTATTVSPSHTYASAGTYTVGLTVTDNQGATGTTSTSVTVTAANVAPTASFTSMVMGMTITANASASNDPDGSIASYAWTFGDSASATPVGYNVAHTYSTPGTYTLGLTVTDNQGATGTVSRSVTVPNETTSVWNGSSELAATAKVYNGTTESTPASISLQPPNYLITDYMSTVPFYSGHRGSGQVWPEHTLESYLGAIQAGAKAIELSVQLTSDGVWVCHHDTTTTRMTGQTYTIASTPYSTLAALTNNTSQSFLGPNSDAPPIPLLSDVLDALWGKVVLFVECKTGTTANVNAMFETILPARGSDYLTRVISKSYWTNTYAAQHPQALGYKTWVYTDATMTDANLATVSSMANYIGIPTYPYGGASTMADVDVSRVVALGKPVIGWEMWYKWQTTHYLALGVNGYMSSALPYNSRGPRRTTDNFASGKRMPGDFVYHGDSQPSYSGSSLVMPNLVTSYLMGSMYLPVTSGYSIDFQMQWSTVTGSTANHHGIAFGMADDQRYKFGTAALTAGYNVVLTRGGSLSLNSHAIGDTSITSIGSPITTAAITSTLTVVRIHIEVTTNTIKIQRLDDGSMATTYSDTTYRGQFFWLCQNNTTDRVSFSAVKTGLL